MDEMPDKVYVWPDADGKLYADTLGEGIYTKGFWYQRADLAPAPMEPIRQCVKDAVQEMVNIDKPTLRAAVDGELLEKLRRTVATAKIEAAVIGVPDCIANLCEAADKFCAAYAKATEGG